MATDGEVERSMAVARQYTGTKLYDFAMSGAAEKICHGVSEKELNSPITDLHIADLAFMLTTWEELVPYLGLTPAEEEAIQLDYRGRYGLQKRQALRKWKSKLGSGPNGATYRQLVIALCLAREKGLAEKVRELLTEPEKMATSATDHVLETFRKYLVDCYSITKHPSQTQWPFSQSSSYIDLTLVQAPVTQMPLFGQGESQAKPQPLKEVQLSDLFHLGSQHAKRKVVLIEGPAGCGKTTLSWHACQEWAAGRLFQHFSLLIHVSLEDPAVLSAKYLADIIPHESSEMREVVARVISKSHGKSVCFLFDAWDEAPRVLQGRNSYLFQFITGTSTRMLPRCSIIVTSRPVAAGLLYHHLSAHVEIRGFGAMKLKEYIDVNLENHDSKQRLLQELQEKPQVNDLCNLPINAAIVVHLFRSFSSTLPSTRTGLFKALVCNLLLRHMQLRTDYGLQEVQEFENLPDDVLQEFKSVCDLAFRGITEERKIFHLDSLSQVGQAHPSSSLGLMQSQQQLTGFGARHCYSFLHYAVQEFLAAYHISKLSEEEPTKVSQILHSTSPSTVLPFYAGLTGNKGACGIDVNVTEDPIGKDEVPREKLDSPITDIHIADLAFMLTTWEELAPYLGLTLAEEEEIQVDYQGRYGLQKRQALRKWQSKLGSGPNGATYHNLITALYRAQKSEMAEKVRKILTESEESATSISSRIFETFKNYLVDCYTITRHPSQTQWPFSRLSSYIDLTLVQAPDIQMPQSGQGESQTEPQPLIEIQLRDLFHVGSHQVKRKVILIEGPAGCGKTILSWHACREWAAGNLFQQSTLLIHISLEDPAVLAAKYLADIIPHESSEMREAVARIISERHGENVCFLFDAWDEAPRVLQGRNSYLFQFITGASTRMLPRCSIIITSRPVAAGLLYPHLTAHVKIRGFGEMKLKEFIKVNLEDHASRQKLLQELQEKPQVNDLCSLPLNAAIVVHLFCSFCSTLPSTRTGLFEALVTNLLLRHMQLRTDHGLQFECLPDDTLKEFRSVCNLAFCGVMQERSVFLLDSLRQLGLVPSAGPLGLVQAQQQLTCFGARHCYSFLHFAVQEFLAAYHISKLSEEEQTKVFGQILHNFPLSTVLPFYSGLTRLSNKDASSILLEVTQLSLGREAVIHALKHTLHESSDRRRLLLALVNCIYESQKPSVCKLVNPPLHSVVFSAAQETHGSVPGLDALAKMICNISFARLGLDPVDCLSIGYFIRSKCLVSEQFIVVDLEHCYIGDTEIEILLKQIRQMHLRVPRIDLRLDHNIMSHTAIKSVSDTLIQSSALRLLSLDICFHPTVTDIKSALKFLIEGVSKNLVLQSLSIMRCSLGPAHSYHLALLASVYKAKYLDLSHNNIRSAIPFIAEAIKHNRVIETLHLTNCSISDRELLLLGKALQQNDVLTTLDIETNSFSSYALTLFLKGFIGTNSKLCTLVVHHLSNEQRHTIAIINSLRFYKSAPPLEIPNLPFVKIVADESVHSIASASPDILTRSAFRDK